MRTACGVGLVVLGLTLATIRGALGGGQDEEIPLLQTASLIHDHDLSFDADELAEVRRRCSAWEDAVRPGRDGRWHSVYGPAQSLAAVPLYLLGRLAAGGESGDRRIALVRWICAFNPLLTAGTAALLAWWVMALGTGRRAAVGASLGFLATTLAWPYAKTFLSEPLSALCLLVAAVAWWAGRERPGPLAVAGGALAAAVLVRPHNVVLAPVLAVAVARRPRAARDLAILLAPVAAAVGWWLVYNRARFGAPLDFGYLPEVRSDFALRNLPEGLLGQLLSPGRGLLFYAPTVVLIWWGWPALRRRDARLARVLLALVAVQALFYSLRSVWWGNWCWGPRYFVPVLPLLAVLAAPWGEGAGPGRQRLAVALALLGLAGAWAGLVVYNGLYQYDVFALPGGVRKLLWSPSWSPLAGHWRYAAAGRIDLLLWQVARVAPGVALADLTLRLAPALAGGWLLAREAWEARHGRG